jgi:FtsP/CotA-like multicopper oxidase with cupredoxin domain
MRTYQEKRGATCFLTRLAAGLAILSVLAGASLFSDARAAAVFNLKAGATAQVMAGTGEVVTLWGFGLENGPITVPGPVLTIPPGETTLEINLTNNLTDPVSLVIPGLKAAMSPTFSGGRVMSFTSETAPSATQKYTWTNVRPGTFLYLSGTNPAVQVQMGLYGAVKKDYAVRQAYSSAATAYDSDVILFFSEIDPAFHADVAQGQYGPTLTRSSAIAYHPKYYLINGRSYSAGNPPTQAGTGRVLMRFLNAGLQTQVPVLQGLYMKIQAEDAYVLPYPREQYSLILPAGRTADVLVQPASIGMVPLYDRRLKLTNEKLPDGGMLTNILFGHMVYMPLIYKSL